jgi:hypothetical protein
MPGWPQGCSTPPSSSAGDRGGGHPDRRRDRLLLSPGHPAAALTSGCHWAFWVNGLTSLAAVPLTFLLIRRKELAQAVVTSAQTERPATATTD